MKKFERIYIEITNSCNLHCPFCNITNRKKQFLDEKQFDCLLDKLLPYTNNLYFHVLGEPLLHPNINGYIDKASKNFSVNITTNGYLINKIVNNKNISKISISLHSFNESYGVSLDDYLSSIVTVTDHLKECNTLIHYRLWVNNKYSQEIIDFLSNHYNKKVSLNSMEIEKNVYLDIDREFSWPDLSNEKKYVNGTCLGLRKQAAILVDGTVVPCCLDSEGIINLGNIYEQELSEIISSDRSIKIVNGFQNGHKCEELCKTCNFYEQRKDTIKKEKIVVE